MSDAQLYASVHTHTYKLHYIAQYNIAQINLRTCAFDFSEQYFSQTWCADGNVFSPAG